MRDVRTGPFSRRQVRVRWRSLASVVVGCAATTALPIGTDQRDSRAYSTHGFLLQRSPVLSHNL